MTVQEALDYINNFTWSKSRLGLSRTKELLERLGNPQNTLKFVHVAGSNGKGSTCAMTESVLRAAGYKTGLYISPFIEDFRGKHLVVINKEPTPADEKAELLIRGDVAEVFERTPGR